MWKKMIPATAVILAPLGLLIAFLIMGFTWKIDVTQTRNPYLSPQGGHTDSTGMINYSPLPTVDIFGNPLDDFARKVIENRGLAGTVIMADQPISEAQVTLTRISPNVNVASSNYAEIALESSERNVQTVNTDKDGKFAFYNLEVGHYGIEASTGDACGVADMLVLPGSIPGNKPQIEYVASRAQIPIVLRPSGELKGSLLTQEGAPLANVEIFPIQNNCENETSVIGPAQVVLLSTKTNSDGTFLFPHLTAGQWELAIHVQGYPDLVTDWLPTGDKPVEVRMRSNVVGAKNTVVGIELVWVPAGTFLMGSPPEEKDREETEKQHQVTLTSGFWLGQYEVTQAQWSEVMGYNPSSNIKEGRPVDSVSWDACQEFIRKLNEKGEGIFRLPTEAEWEYACRAGSTTRFYWGDDINDVELSKYAWSEENSFDGTRVVGQKRPNAWGLFDMSGNICEYCQDWLGEYPERPVTDPQGPETGERRVVRGGAWMQPAAYCRSADRRLGLMTNTPMGYFGLRLVWQPRFVTPQAAPSSDVPQPNPTATTANANDFTKTTWEVSPTDFGPVVIELLPDGVSTVSVLGIKVSGTWMVQDTSLIVSAEVLGKKQTVHAEIKGNTLFAEGFTIRRIH